MATRPLENKTIVITRSEIKSMEFAQRIKELGGTPVVMPLLSFEPTSLSETEKITFNRLDEFDWLVFTSSNGIDYFFYHAEQLGIEFKENQFKIAVIGENTRITLEKRGFETSILPSEFVAEGLIRAFQKETLESVEILYLQGDLARDLIPTKLTDLGAKVTKLTVYRTICPSVPQDWIELLQQDIDAITFTSPSTIKHFTKVLDGVEWDSWIQKIVVCCIGPITEKAAKSYGIIPSVVPHTYTMEHLLQELILFYKKREGLK